MLEMSSWNGKEEVEAIPKLWQNAEATDRGLELDAATV